MGEWVSGWVTVGGWVIVKNVANQYFKVYVVQNVANLYFKRYIVEHILVYLCGDLGPTNIAVYLCGGSWKKCDIAILNATRPRRPIFCWCSMGGPLDCGFAGLWLVDLLFSCFVILWFRQVLEKIFKKTMLAFCKKTHPK